jgi:hypothetical protein
LWSAPAATWQWHVAYAWHVTEIGYPPTIPIFDG